MTVLYSPALICKSMFWVLRGMIGGPVYAFLASDIFGIPHQATEASLRDVGDCVVFLRVGGACGKVAQ